MDKQVGDKVFCVDVLAAVSTTWYIVLYCIVKHVNDAIHSEYRGCELRKVVVKRHQTRVVLVRAS